MITLSKPSICVYCLHSRHRLINPGIQRPKIFHFGYEDQSILTAIIGISRISEVKRKKQKLKGLALCLLGLYKSKTFGGNLMQDLWTPVTEKSEYNHRD